MFIEHGKEYLDNYTFYPESLEYNCNIFINRLADSGNFS